MYSFTLVQACRSDSVAQVAWLIFQDLLLLEYFFFLALLAVQHVTCLKKEDGSSGAPEIPGKRGRIHSVLPVYLPRWALGWSRCFISLDWIVCSDPSVMMVPPDDSTRSGSP